jgi:hypothetical protein
MPDVLLSNDDITVLGPPEIVEVLVDIGPTGTRGSQTYVGAGDPNLLMSGSTIFGRPVILNDLYINTSPGPDYAYMYQYISAPGGNTWVEILRLNPTIYGELHLTTYESGTGEVVIPIENIVTVTGGALTASNFIIQHSVAHTNPVATSISGQSIVGDNLVLEFEAVEYTGSAWQALDDTVTMHIFINIRLGDQGES